jgi:hypothetical protein
MISTNVTVRDGKGNVYRLCPAIPQHRKYIKCAMEQDYANKSLQELEKDPRQYWDSSRKEWLNEWMDTQSKLTNWHRESRKALGECFEEFKQT